MKRIVFGCLLLLGFSLFTSRAVSQKMSWTTNSKEASKQAGIGITHLMNVEFPQAYEAFSNAVKLDPNFTPPLVLLANMSVGATRKAIADRALKSAENKTEGEKLFASLVEAKDRATAGETLAKLHQMFPDGSLIAWYYSQTRATDDERFQSAENNLKKFPDNPAFYNTMAYLYMQTKKDNTKAKEYFDKYLAMYPDGDNPYNSMGEYYLNVGDTTNSKKYYMMSLEKYPFNSSSIEALQKLNGTGK
ncbi:MAG: tetratricopeptide repeat protein [Ginsengibacter sp.]